MVAIAIAAVHQPPVGAIARTIARGPAIQMIAHVAADFTIAASARAGCGRMGRSAVGAGAEARAIGASAVMMSMVMIVVVRSVVAVSRSCIGVALGVRMTVGGMRRRCLR